MRFGEAVRVRQKIESFSKGKRKRRKGLVHNKRSSPPGKVMRHKTNQSND